MDQGIVPPPAAEGVLARDGLTSDVDLSLRVRERGYRVICTPFAPLLHLELATRGPDNTPERVERLERERDVVLARWPQLAREDPCFNANLQLAEGPTRLADPPRLAPIAAGAMDG